MNPNRATDHHGGGRWRLGVVACCCLALTLVLVAVAAASSPTWFRGGVSLTGLILLGVGGGLLVAHLLLDEHPPSGRPRRPMRSVPLGSPTAVTTTRHFGTRR